MEAYIGGWYSTQTGGFHRLVPALPDYLSVSTDGWWVASGIDYVTIGNLSGVGYISGVVDYQEAFYITGDVSGVGYISSLLVYDGPIFASGIICGYGSISYRINRSRSKALFPRIIKEKTPYEDFDCPIAAIEYEGFSPNKIINIISYEDDYYENTLDYSQIDSVTSTGIHYTLTHYPHSDDPVRYLITNYKSDKENGKPLFYQYELLYDSYGIQEDEIISIYKNNEYKIDKANYLVQYNYNTLSNTGVRYDNSTWGLFDPEQTVHRTRVLFPLEFNDPADFYMIKYKKSVYGALVEQEEFIELKPLYTQFRDFSVSSSNGLTISGTIPLTSELHVIKDPDYKIKPISLITSSRDIYEGAEWQTDQTSNWSLQVNGGYFLMGSGISNNSRYYKLEKATTYPLTSPVANVHPEIITDTILRVKETPIFVQESAFVYPYYEVGVYNNVDLALTTPTGQFVVIINGVLRSDIKIKSIDREKGYIQIDQPVSDSDDVELSFYVKNDKRFIVDNLELNPKIQDTIVNHISGYLDGMGLALLPNDADLYIYDSSLDTSSRTYINVYDNSTLPYSGTFIDIGELNVNRLSTEMIKLTDARRINSTKLDMVDTWFQSHFPSGNLKIHEQEWYTNVGYYGGEPLAHGSLVILHIPWTSINALKTNFLNYYNTNISGDYYYSDKGTKEFKFYLNQCIRKYLSAGSDYILIPTDSQGNFSGILNLDY